MKKVVFALLIVLSCTAFILRGGGFITPTPPPGPLPSFSVQNPTGSAISSSHYVSFGQAFATGAAPAGQALSLNISSVGTVATQLDCKVVYVADGSCKHGVVTINAPAMAGSATLSGTYSLVAGGGTPVDISTACSAGPWAETVTINELGPNNGSTFTENLCTLLTAAVASKTSFTGVVAGTTLTSSSVTGTIAVGHWLWNSSFNNGLIPYGIMVTASCGANCWTLNAPVATALTGSTHTSTTIDTIAINGATTDPRLFGWKVGMAIAGTGIPANTTVSALSSTAITLSQATTSSGSAVALTAGLPSGAMNSATYSVWRAGPQATEIRFDQALDGSAHMVVDLTLHADNSVKTDVQILNDQALAKPTFSFFYNESIVQNGSTVVSYPGQTCTGSISNGSSTLTTGCTLKPWEGIEVTGVFPAATVANQFAGSSPYTLSNAATGALAGGTFHTAGVAQYHYMDHHDIVWSNGAPPHNIIRDVATFQNVNLLPPLDLQTPSASAYLSNFTTALSNTSFCGRPALPICNIHTDFGSGGGDDPPGYIGMTEAGAAVWMATQDKTAETFSLAASDTGAYVPWHQWDQTKGYWLNIRDYPAMFWQNCIGVAGTGNNDCILGNQNFAPWYMSGTYPVSHMPDTSYVPYLFTGERFRLDIVDAQANFGLAWLWDQPRNNNGTNDALLSAHQETRSQAWATRANLYSDQANPIGTPAQRFARTALVDSFNWAAGYIGGTKTAAFSAIEINRAADITKGVWPADYLICFATGTNLGGVGMFQVSYLNQAISFAVKNGYGADAQATMDYVSNHQIQASFPHTSWDPYKNSAYIMMAFDSNGGGQGAFFHDWSSVSSGNSWCSSGPGTALATPLYGPFNGVTWADGNYAEVTLASLAAVINGSSSALMVRDAMQAYAWMVSQNNAVGATPLGYINAYTAGSTDIGAGGFFNDFQHQVRPTLPDGTRVQYNQIQRDASNTNVTLTSSGGTSILATWGTGADTLVGGSGGDLLYSGTTGNNTITAGTGNQYLYGPLHTAGYSCTGTNLFRDNTGNNFMRGSTVCGANTFEFGGQSVSNSGVDTVENFRPGTDKLKIKTTLDVNSFANEAAFLATGATVSGSCVYTLGGGNTITTTGVTCASTNTTDVTMF